MRCLPFFEYEMDAHNNILIMKTKIKEVHDYFRDKLINGDFKVDRIVSHEIYLIVDNKYPFIIWSANKDYGLQTQGADTLNKGSFMDINFREEDKKALWGKIKPIIKKYNDTIVLKTKELEFEKLKKELNK